MIQKTGNISKTRIQETVLTGAIALVISLTLMTLPVMSVAAQTKTTPDREVRSSLEEWQDTLQYGINSEIVDLLPTLTENKVESVLPEVVALFNTTNNNDVILGTARYLETLKSSAGHDRAISIVDVYQDWNDEILVSLMGYLRETDADIPNDTLETLEQIIKTRPAGPATAAVRLYAAAGASSDDLMSLYRETDVSDDVRGRILIELGDRGDPNVYDFVQDIIRDDEEATTTLQRYALDTLGKLGDERALPVIIRQFSSKDAMTRAYAAAALAGFDTPESRVALEAALKDEFWRVRVSALQTISEQAVTDALEAVLYKVRRDPEQRVRLEAVKTIAALDMDEGWRELEDLAVRSATGITVRSAIIEQLLTKRPGESKSVILDIVDKEWDQENSKILDTIGKVVSRTSDPAVTDIVQRLLVHPNYIIRIYGIRAVGNNGLQSLSDTVVESSREGNHRAVRSAALRSLEQLGIQPPGDDSPD